MKTVEIKGYKYNIADFNSMDYESFVEQFSKTFEGCDLANCYQLLTGRSPNPVKKSENGKVSGTSKKAGKV